MADRLEDAIDFVENDTVVCSDGPLRFLIPRFSHEGAYRSTAHGIEYNRVEVLLGPQARGIDADGVKTTVLCEDPSKRSFAGTCGLIQQVSAMRTVTGSTPF